jgi:hypothetical protein
VTGQDGLLNSLRGIVGQEASIPGLRAALFLFAALAALAWVRRRPFVSLLALCLGGSLGLGYWLVQIVSPLGFGTDPTLTLEWAQAGVSAGAGPRGTGVVSGTDPQVSLISLLANAGIPFEDLVFVPAAAAFLTFGLLILLPFVFSRNRATAALAASLAASGGLWPGIAPYGSILLRPSALLGACTVVLLLLLAARRVAVSRALHRSRLAASIALVGAATLDRALGGGAEPGAFSALAHCAAAIILASPLRAALRSFVPAPLSRRRAEGFLLLCVLGGSGLVWWDPPTSVRGFNAARDENKALRQPMAWIRSNVPADSVVLASPLYSASIAAFAGRRVLFLPSVDSGTQTSLPEPFRRARLAESARRGRPLARLAESFGVTHLFLGPGEPGPPLVTDAPSDGETVMALVPEYRDLRDFRVFRLVKK